MNTIDEKISKLRNVMLAENISAYLIPGSDPHSSEYIPDHWKEREWISGFDGSAGNIAITSDFSGLWTDSRYFLQADSQLKNTEIQLMKSGLLDSVEIPQWLTSNLKAGDIVAVNPEMMTVNAYQALKSTLELHQIKLTGSNLISLIWDNRPELPENKIFVYNEKFAGKSTEDKIKEVKKLLADSKTDTLIVSGLDEVAWLLNLRGNDVDYNPVFIAYVMIQAEETTLFVNQAKIESDIADYLQSQGVKIKDYSEIVNALSGIPGNSQIFVDPNRLNFQLYSKLPLMSEKRMGVSPVFRMKSIKNKIEIEGVRQAMRRDGVALVKYFIWLEENIESTKLTELSISKKLYQFRAEQELFFGESFGTICGYGGHGAIVHYNATPESDAEIKKGQILLLDSGGQYLDGTTDITRTLSLGNITSEQKTDYTLVLKGHIGIATVQFPLGTRGSQLDILARKAMWDRGMNYFHGTGHGVGHFLNVHEGPQSIRMDENPTILQPGMILSNEPGLYKTDKHGIRTENLILVRECEKTEFGQFLAFETLTLFPIATDLIDFTLMTKDEIEWLNAYHQQVFDNLSHLLNQKENEWLKSKCNPVSKN